MLALSSVLGSVSDGLVRRFSLTIISDAANPPVSTHLALSCARWPRIPGTTCEPHTPGPARESLFAVIPSPPYPLFPSVCLKIAPCISELSGRRPPQSQVPLGRMRKDRQPGSTASSRIACRFIVDGASFGTGAIRLATTRDIRIQPIYLAQDRSP